MLKILTGICGIFLLLITSAYAETRYGIDQQMIERNTGALGAFNNKQKTFRVADPRDDFPIMIYGVKFATGMGMTSWAKFKKIDENSEVVGSLVVSENQVNPVIKLLQSEGLEVTELHNHMLWEKPRVMYLHFEGMGDQKHLAIAVGKLFKFLKAPNKGRDFPLAVIDPDNTTLSAAKLGYILGHKPDHVHGVYRIVLTKTLKGDTSPSINNTAIFVGTDEAAAVDGNMVLKKEDLNKVIAKLSTWGISVLAVHPHVADSDDPKVFLHYFGIGKASKLATGVRSAMNSIG